MPFSFGVPVILKSLRKKDYSEAPKTLGEHLKKRRRELGLLQREAAKRMGILTETYLNWEKGHTQPVASQFRPVFAFLGYDPSPAPRSLAERLEAKRRATGMTFGQIAEHLGWDPATLHRYLRVWRLNPDRAATLEVFLSADFSPLKLPPNVDAGFPVRVHKVAPVAHESPSTGGRFPL